MAVGIVQNLNPSGPSDIPGSTHSKVGGIADAIGGVTTALKSFKEMKDQENLNQATAALSDIEVQTARYAQSMLEVNTALNDAIQGHADAQVINGYVTQLKRLQLGQEQGVLSPTKARIEIENRSRELIRQYPGLASEIAKVKGAVTDNVRTMDFKPGEDSFTKGRDAKLFELQSKYGDINRGLVVEGAIEKADAARRTLEAATTVGTLKSQQLVTAIQSSAQSVYVGVLNSMINDLNRGTADPNNLAIYISQARNQILGGAQQLRTQLMETSSETGIPAAVFSEETVRSGYAATLQALDDLKSTMSSFSTIDYRRKLLETRLKQAEIAEIDFFNQRLGPFLGPTARRNPQYAMDAMVGFQDRVGDWIKNELPNRAAFEATGLDKFMVGIGPDGKPNVPMMYDLYGSMAGYILGDKPLPPALDNPAGRRFTGQESTKVFKKQGLTRAKDPESFDKAVMLLDGVDIWRNPWIMNQIVPNAFDDAATQQSKAGLIRNLGLKLAEEAKRRFETMTGNDLAMIEIGPNGVALPDNGGPPTTLEAIASAASGGWGGGIPSQQMGDAFRAGRIKDLNDTYKLYERLVGKEAAFEEFNKAKDLALGVYTPEIGAPKSFGKRQDGTEKGTGWLGPIPMTDGTGDVMTEKSISVDFDGRRVEIPTLVEGLSPAEIAYMQAGGDPRQMPSIMDKAINSAKERLKQGLSPFKNDGPATD